MATLSEHYQALQWGLDHLIDKRVDEGENIEAFEAAVAHVGHAAAYEEMAIIQGRTWTWKKGSPDQDGIYMVEYSCEEVGVACWRDGAWKDIGQTPVAYFGPIPPPGRDPSVWPYPEEGG